MQDPPEGRTTFLQRYFLCPEYWASGTDGEKGPIFVYLGNEDDVTLYAQLGFLQVFGFSRLICG